MPQVFTSWESIYLPLRAAFPNEIKHMKFGRRMTQQMGEVPESLGVLRFSGVLKLCSHYSRL